MEANGTSPRAWGEVVPARDVGGAERNIPTGVGRRRSGCARSGGRPEHPHGRGEKVSPGA